MITNRSFKQFVRACTHLVNQNAIKSIFIIHVVLSSTYALTVSVQLNTTRCPHNCTTPPSNTNHCLSSIMINGEEYSRQQDHFNIVFIDSNSRCITNRYFKYRTTRRQQLMPTFKNLKHIFTNVSTNSVVFVVPQKDCSNFDNRWYVILRRAGIDIAPLTTHKQSHYVGLIVGCKGSCSDWSNTTIPFGYQVNNKILNISFSFTFNGKSDTQLFNTGEIRVIKSLQTELSNVKASKKKQKHLGSLLGGIIAFVFAVCIATILYVTNKRSPYDSIPFLEKKSQENTEGRVINTKDISVSEGLDDETKTLNQAEQSLLSLGKSSQIPNLQNTPISSPSSPSAVLSTHTKSLLTPTSVIDVVHYQPVSEVSQWISSNITSVSSLVNEDSHSLESAILEPGGITFVSSLVGGAFLNNTSTGRAFRNSKSRRHSKKHNKKN